MSTNKSSISNTRLLSLIVVLSVVALSFVLNGGNKTDTQPLSMLIKPNDSVLDTSRKWDEKTTVKETSMKFPLNPDALVLSI